MSEKGLSLPTTQDSATNQSLTPEQTINPAHKTIDPTPDNFGFVQDRDVANGETLPNVPVTPSTNPDGSDNVAVTDNTKTATVQIPTAVIPAKPAYKSRLFVGGFTLGLIGTVLPVIITVIPQLQIDLTQYVTANVHNTVYATFLVSLIMAIIGYVVAYLRADTTQPIVFRTKRKVGVTDERKSDSTRRTS